MKKIFPQIATILAAICLLSCDPVKDTREETGVKGEITIAVDQTLQPVMEQQMKVWDSSYPQGKIHTIYTSESDAFKKLFSDSVRLIVTTRDITEQEKQHGLQKKVVYSSLGVAKDAVAIIVHPDAEDGNMTFGMLRNILRDSFPRKYNVVFDQAGSGMVKFIEDSVLAGDTISTKRVYVAGTNEAVVEYVSKHKDALGIVGLSHIYDKEDVTGQGVFLKNIKVVALRNEDRDSTFEYYQPYQAYIALNKYPLSRTIYFVTGETWRGLGTGFANFLSQPQGQAVFKTSFMVPLRVQLQIIEGHIKN